MAKVAKAEIIRQTVLVIPQGGDRAQLSTFDRKWQNKMAAAVANGFAEEVESSVPGAMEFDFDVALIRLPYTQPRAAREYTEEELEVVRERLAGVRASVLAAKQAAAKKAGKKTAAPAPKAAPVKAGKKPAPVEEDEDEEEDEKPTRSPAQLAATERLKAANAARRAGTTVPAKKGAPVATKSAPAKKVTKKVVEEEVDEDDLEEVEDEEEVEEVIVKRPVPPARKVVAGSKHSK